MAVVANAVSGTRAKPAAFEQKITEDADADNESEILLVGQTKGEKRQLQSHCQTETLESNALALKCPFTTF